MIRQDITFHLNGNQLLLDLPFLVRNINLERTLHQCFPKVCCDRSTPRERWELDLSFADMRLHSDWGNELDAHGTHPAALCMMDESNAYPKSYSLICHNLSYLS